MASNTGPTGLLIRLDMGEEYFGLGHSADYLTDGTVIRRASNGSLLRDTLTPSGLAAVRALLAKDTDLLAAPLVVTPQVAPGTHPSLLGDMTDLFVLERADGTRYTVTVPSTTSGDAPTWVPDPSITRLNALATALLDPVTLVGAGGLAHPAWVTYEPTTAALFVRLSAVARGPDPTSVFGGPYIGDLRKTGWRFGEAPDTYGSSFNPYPAQDVWVAAGSRYGMTYRCGFLPYADAITAFTSLDDEGRTFAPGDMATGGAWTSATVQRWDDFELTLRARALLPEDVAGSCAEALAH